MVDGVAYLDEDFGLLVVVELPAFFVFDEVGCQHFGKAVFLDLLEVLLASHCNVEIFSLYD